MRLVLDTNTLVSGALWHGAPHLLLEAARDQRFTLCTCHDILLELLCVLNRPKFTARLKLTSITPRKIIKEYLRLAVMIQPPVIIPKISRDPTDDIVVACALQAGAYAVVSGDKDLLILKSYQGIHIIDPVSALQRLP
ncbi:putative toxin-antitoxin system toxin component, PIN family [Duganella callida]|uniref:Putative toxin-antitoxin system toxin component, PIN family n=1 Tax=Duganella callida TaxID=2561932 RepID=A0A4Y9SFE6_9BURK|nr:putative toxin-antitoxin system toxin component, PIN family [Duganella callida]TFW22270.1 putative toxin-antitoxin system toxin component, PIN family [Duganella callida]